MDELAKIPEKHTFLFIKEKARCAVTFVRKDLIGILYERLPKSPKSDVIVQGLAGRACGYDVDDGIIVFTDVDSIKCYVKMLNSGFKDREGFTFTGLNSKTHLHPRGYKNSAGEASVEEEESPAYTTEPNLEVFNTHEEAKAYWKEMWEPILVVVDLTSQRRRTNEDFSLPPYVETHTSTHLPKLRQTKGGG